ncbi:MAG: ABC transporter ATP-binding protein [Dehalococcoidia bacterium]|nr:ABC transporter ATP-binding protein [Dehalococcoidia bacterium]
MAVHAPAAEPARHAPVLLRLLRLSFPHLRDLIVTLVSVIASGALVVVTPWLIGHAIDVGLAVDSGARVARGDMATLAVASALLIAAALARGALMYQQAILSERVSQAVAYDLRNRIYDHLQRLSFAYHDKAEIGQIMSRATQDVEGVRFFVSMGVIRLLYIVALVGVTAGIMLATNVRVALVALAFVPIVAGAAVWSSRAMRPVWTRIQNLQGELANVLHENLTGQRVVKAFAREAFEEEKFGREATALFDESYRSTRFMGIVEPAMGALWLVSLAVVFWVGGREVIAGRMGEGQLVTFQLYLTFLQMPVRSVGFIVGIASRAQSSGDRIFELLDAESAVTERAAAAPLQPGPGDVRFEHVSFSYGASPVLSDVSLHARPGEVFALLGPTGSGKSTVVNLLPRFYDVTGGAITVDGHDVRDVTLASLRGAVGIVQQDVFLFADTIRRNIAYGRPDASDDDVIAAARAARLHDFIAGLPDGYDTWVGERGVTLSGGQRQRIAIARTLLLDPRILVFDDSTSSVDTETEYLIQQALHELMRGRTTFVIAQRLRTVRSADQILVLRNGRIVEQGRHEQLLAAGGLYRDIYDLELRDQEESRAPAPAASLAGDA